MFVNSNYAFFQYRLSMFVECALKLRIILRSLHISGKLIYHTPRANHIRTTQHDQGAHMGTRLSDAV